MKKSKIVEALTKSLGDIAEKVTKSINIEEDKDDDTKAEKKVNVSINFDEKVLAKHLNDENTETDDKVIKEEDYVDEYDEMSKDELTKACKEKDIKVFSGTTEKMMKKKLRDYDENHDEEIENDDNNDNDDDKMKNATKVIKKSLSKVLKENGIDEKDLSFDISLKGNKQSIVKKKKKDEEEERFDDKDKDVVDGIDLNDEEAVMKAFEDLPDDEREELLGYYIGKRYFETDPVISKKVKDDDDDDDDDDD